jgi:oligopeptide transport system substrate-binding protein
LNKQRSRWLATALVGIGVVTVPMVGNAASPQSAGGGGEIIDGSTFPLGVPNHIDPQLNTELDSYQVISALYDGLTDIDATDPENVHTVPHQAESYEPNEDATVWTFHIREGLQFADGEPILPSSYKRTWERAAALGGDYSYLLTFIEGGAEALDAGGGDISGVVADDEAMTLTVTLSAPYANFDAVAGFQMFMPTPEVAVDEGENYENTAMVGSGPYTMEEPRNDQQIVLVKNDTWGGDFNGETWDTRADRIVFLISADVDTSYNAMEAGEADSASIPAGRSEEARSNWSTSLDVSQLASYYFSFNAEDPRVGGDENLLLRQAISQAIDRDAINEAIFNGMRTTATGITPPGIPGFIENICDYCAYDPDAAQAAYDEWVAAGNAMDGPLPIQFAIGGVHEGVVDIIVENLAAIGIEAEPDGRISETYFAELTDGACVFCRDGWIADYPTYDNFMFDLFGTEAIGGNNHALYSNPDFDGLIAEAKETTDADARNELFHQAEDILLNQDIATVPINWYVGDLAWNPECLDGFSQSVIGLVAWEQITVLGCEH